MGSAERLKDFLGPEKVITDPAIVDLYAREPSGLASKAMAVVFPESSRDVSRIAAYAYKNNIKIYPQGSTSALSGSAVPSEEGIVLSFERMNRVLGVSVVDSTVDVEPGVRLGDLNIELARHGYMFPIDPGSVNVATVGGSINSGAGGLRGARYGTMRDWVLGLNIVLPDEKGTELRIGCRTTKCRQGYDLVRLMVGSEGTLAIVTEATLKITPLPEAMVTALTFFTELEDLYEAYKEIKESRVLPLVLEFMDYETALLAKEASGAPVEVEGHMLLVGVDCNREAVKRVEAWLSELMRRHNAKRVFTAIGQEEAERLFTLRRSLFPAQVFFGNKRYPGKRLIVLLEDIAVPPSRLLEAINRIREVSNRYGLQVSMGGHVGDGNLHPSVAFPVDDEQVKRKVMEWHREVAKIALELGGTVSAEHGIGTLKRGLLEMEMEALGSKRALELMRGIKRVFDPKGILNPGKVI
ncbi:MAG: FAD-binding protein [Acidilobaceae archaeon]|nr:FAD-binding protein [Acidilobaceae archaeon]MDW7974812.1 FAD-linked oxidase C-terminal domain-containing protein [Sulfolobales archaeon]